MGENPKVVWAEFSTLSQTVLLVNNVNAQQAHTGTSKIESQAQVLYCQLKFVHG